MPAFIRSTYPRERSSAEERRNAPAATAAEEALGGSVTVTPSTVKAPESATHRASCHSSRHTPDCASTQPGAAQHSASSSVEACQKRPCGSVRPLIVQPNCAGACGGVSSSISRPLCVVPARPASLVAPCCTTTTVPARSLGTCSSARVAALETRAASPQRA